MKLTNLEQAIGHTPILELKKLNTTATHLWAKLEMFNPFSVKDRAALFMLTPPKKRAVWHPAERLWNPPAAILGLHLPFWPPHGGIK